MIRFGSTTFRDMKVVELGLVQKGGEGEKIGIKNEEKCYSVPGASAAILSPQSCHNSSSPGLSKIVYVVKKTPTLTIPRPSDTIPTHRTKENDKNTNRRARKGTKRNEKRRGTSNKHSWKRDVEVKPCVMELRYGGLVRACDSVCFVAMGLSPRPTCTHARTHGRLHLHERCAQIWVRTGTSLDITWMYITHISIV